MGTNVSQEEVDFALNKIKGSTIVTDRILVNTQEFPLQKRKPQDSFVRFKRVDDEWVPMGWQSIKEVDIDEITN